MKFLFIAKQKKNVDGFAGVIRALLGADHQVALAIEDRDPERDVKLHDIFESPGFSLQAAPTSRSDEWRTHARLVRRFRDWVQYLGPEYAAADKLRQRVADKFRADFDAAGISPDVGRLLALGEIAPAGPLRPSTRARDALSSVEGRGTRLTESLHQLLAHIESSIPSDPLHEEFVSRDRPDVVLVTPGVHFGSAQADFITSARSAGIPVWMLLFSWDNLSTKGALHVFPDLMFVWNERQRREATELHAFPGDRVVVVGAPRFDEFFSLRSALSRSDFHAPLGLDPRAQTLLYLCSSRFVAEHELPFVRRWLAALRGSTDASLAGCNVLVRPHPDIALLDDQDEAEMVRWAGLRDATGYVNRPFDDSRAIVLRTSNKTPQPFFECVHHASAVVGLNTSAALEAGIVGRPVFTVLADDDAVTGQANTLHFHYLLKENGGFVRLAANLEAHVEQLSAALTGKAEDESIRRFVAEFLRPCGNRPVAQVFANALIERAGGAPRDVASVADLSDSSPERVRPTSERSSPEPATNDDKPLKTLRIAYPGSTLRVWATPETRTTRRHGELFLNEGMLRWLDEHVRPGDVVYDVGAGVGTYSLVASTHRGALMVAFEPAFVTYKRLCDNILLNNRRRSIVPLPLALGSQSGLFELEYRADSPGEGHTVKERPWKPGPDEREDSYVQPVCVEPLDEVIRRHRVARPHHLRVATARAADAILRGAARTIGSGSLKSLLVAAPDASPGAFGELAAAAGLKSAATLPCEDGVNVLFVRERSRPGRRLPWLGRH